MSVSLKSLVALGVISPISLLATPVLWTGAANDGLWGSAANWSTGSVPIGQDVQFGANTPANLTVTDGAIASQGMLIFDSNAPAITITVTGANFLSVNTAITNNSSTAKTIVNQGGTDQLYQGGQTTFNNVSTGNLNIVNQGAAVGYGGATYFRNNADAGTSVITNLNDATNPSYWGYGNVYFYESSSAGHATLNNQGGAFWFHDQSTAGNSTINNTSGLLYFYENSSAGSATITETASSGIQFNDTSTAGSATITSAGVRFADSSSAGTATITGGASFSGASTAGTARISLTDQLYISDHDAGTVSIGSLEGSGAIYLGANTLAIGALNRDMEFSGYISDFGSGGGLTKTGTGKLIISGYYGGFGDNDYSGVTTIEAGVLQVGNGDIYGSISSTSNVVNNGKLIFDRSDNISFTKVISGSGVLEKQGAGTLTLSGANTFSGGTSVLSGFVSFRNVNVFGSGAITLNGGGLTWGTTTTADISGLLGAIGTGGAFFNTGANNVTLATALTGTGGITKSGSGSMTLSAANSYTDTTVNAGTLTLSGSGTFGTGDILVTGGTLNLGVGTTFGTSDVTVSGGTLNLNAKTGVVADKLTISGGTVSNGTITATSYDGQSGTVSAVLAGTGVALTKTTSGTLTLSGANTYTGGTTISAGILAVTTTAQLGSASSLGLDGGTFQVNNNTSQSFTQAVSVTNSSGITVNRTSSAGTSTSATFSGGLTMGAQTLTITRGSLITGSGTATVAVTGATTLTGDATFAPGANAALTFAAVTGTDTGLTFNGAGSMTISGALSLGTGDIVKSGAGTLTISGSTSYDTTTVNAGTLSIANLGTGLVTINGGTLAYTGAGLGARNLTMNTGGAFSLTNTSGAGTGTLTLNGGGLTWSGSATLDVSSRLVVTGGASFVLGSGNVTFATAFTGTDLSGVGGLTKAGSGTLTLASGTSYVGLTTVSAGTLKTFDSTLFGGAGLTLSGGSATVTSDAAQTTTGALNVSANGTFTFDRVTSGQGLADTFGSLNLAATLTLAKTSNVASGSGSLVITGTSTLSGTPGFTTASGTSLTLNDITSSTGIQLNLDGNMTVMGNISGGISQIAKNNLGTLSLLGTGSTYTGRTTMNAGVVEVAKLADLGQASSIGAPTSVGNGTILLSFNNGAATLRYVGSADSSTNRVVQLAGNTNVGSILDASGTGTVSFTASAFTVISSGTRTLTLTGTNTGANTISSIIPNAPTSGLTSLTKSGTGTWVLGGVNTYTGATAVNAGKLVVNGSLANTAVTVASAATLAGSGSIAGLTTINSGGRLAPGNSPGTITFSNGLKLNNGAILDMELGTVSDLIQLTGGALTGATNVGGVTVNLIGADGFGAGTYTLIDYSNVSVTASGVDLPDFVVGSGVEGYDYLFTNDSGKLQVVVTAVPEPSAYGLIGAGTLAFAAVVVRRRRHGRFAA